MASLPGLLLTYGPLGLMVILLIAPLPGKGVPVLVPWWYVERLDKEAELQKEALEREQEAARRAVAELETANRLIADLRAIAMSRSDRPVQGP